MNRSFVKLLVLTLLMVPACRGEDPVAANLQKGDAATAGLADARTAALAGSPVPVSLVINPPTVIVGEAAAATVTLDAPAGPGGVVIALSYFVLDVPMFRVVVTMPTTLIIPEGAIAGTFSVVPTVLAGVSTTFINARLNTVMAQATIKTVRTVIPGNAVRGPRLAPECSTVGAFCDTGSLIDSRSFAHSAAEIGAPNTINSSCTDGEYTNLAGGPSDHLPVYHVDASLDRLRVFTTDGSALAAGKTVTLEATVWAVGPGNPLEFFSAPDAGNPNWTFVARLTTTQQYVNVLSTTFTLPAGNLQAIRGVFTGAAMQPCSTGVAGATADFDDVVFATDNGGSPTNIAPTVNAGPDRAVALPPVATLSGAVLDDGLPNPPGALTTTWSKVSGPGNVIFGDASARVTTATFSLAGNYVLRLTGSDGALSREDTVSIAVNVGTSTNQPPAVDAGPDQTITLPAGAVLTGRVTDDGSPNPPGAVTRTWSKLNGPGSVTFDDASALQPAAAFSTPGTYTLRLTATDGLLSAGDDVVVTVLAVPNRAPIVNAGSDQTLTLPAVASLVGSSQDDGLPSPPAAIAATWSIISGPGVVVFGNANALLTEAAFSIAGVYTLRLTADDGQLSVSDDVVVTVLPVPNQVPTVSAGPDQVITLPAVASLGGTVSDDGLPTPPGAVVVAWTKVSGPGTIVFAAPAAVTTTATFSASGTYTVRLTASDGALVGDGTATITVNPVPPNQPPVVNAGPDQTITLPAVAHLTATVTDDGSPNPPGAVTTTWSRVSGPGTVIFGNATAKTTTAAFSAGGSYVLRLTAADGGLSANDTVTITVKQPLLKAQYRVTAARGNNNQIRPYLDLFNTGTTSIPLNQVKVRYWYTIDTQQPQTINCDFAQIGCARVTRAFVTASPSRSGADRYVEIGFTSSAGNLGAGAHTGLIQLRWNKNDWSNYNESNDYSYSTGASTAAPTTFVDWSRVTIYQNGTLIWGVEPNP